MNNNRFDEISYDEDWKNVSEPQYAQTAPSYNSDNSYDYSQTEDGNSTEKNQSLKPKKPKQWLIITQLVICIVIFAAFYVLKQSDLEIYEKLAHWYKTEINNSMLTTTDFNDLDLSKFIPTDTTNPSTSLSTDDQV